MAQSNEELSVKELEKGDVDHISMGDLSQRKENKDKDWESLYRESQREIRSQASLVRALERIKILEDRQDALVEKQPLQQPFEKTQIVKSEYSANTEYYKDGWCAKIKWNEKESFRDFVDKLELEYSAVRPKELYWLQLKEATLLLIR